MRAFPFPLDAAALGVTDAVVPGVMVSRGVSSEGGVLPREMVRVGVPFRPSLIPEGTKWVLVDEGTKWVLVVGKGSVEPGRSIGVSS